MALAITGEARIWIRPTQFSSGPPRAVMYAQSGLTPLGAEVWRFSGAPVDAGATSQPNGTIVLVSVNGKLRLGVAYGGRAWAQSNGDERFSLVWTQPLVGGYPETVGSLWVYRLASSGTTQALLVCLTASAPVVGQSVQRWAHLTERIS